MEMIGIYPIVLSHKRTCSKGTTASCLVSAGRVQIFNHEIQSKRKFVNSIIHLQKTVLTLVECCSPQQSNLGFFLYHRGSHGRREQDTTSNEINESVISHRHTFYLSSLIINKTNMFNSVDIHLKYKAISLGMK